MKVIQQDNINFAADTNIRNDAGMAAYIKEISEELSVLAHQHNLTMLGEILRLATVQASLSAQSDPKE